MLMIIACGVSAQMKAFIKKVGNHCLYLAIVYTYAILNKILSILGTTFCSFFFR